LFGQILSCPPSVANLSLINFFNITMCVAIHFLSNLAPNKAQREMLRFMTFCELWKSTLLFGQQTNRQQNQIGQCQEAIRKKLLIRTTKMLESARNIRCAKICRTVGPNTDIPRSERRNSVRNGLSKKTRKWRSVLTRAEISCSQIASNHSTHTLHHVRKSDRKCSLALPI